MTRGGERGGTTKESGKGKGSFGFKGGSRNKAGRTCAKLKLSSSSRVQFKNDFGGRKKKKTQELDRNNYAAQPKNKNKG